MNYLLSDQEYIKLRNYFAAGIITEGLKEVIEKVNKMDLSEIGDEIFLIKKTQVQFPSNENAQKTLDYNKNRYNALISDLESKNRILTKLIQGDISKKYEIPRMLMQLGEAEIISSRFPSDEIDPLKLTPFFKKISDLASTQRDVYIATVLKDFSEKIETYAKDVAMAQTEFDERNVSPLIDYDSTWRNRMFLEYLIIGVQAASNVYYPTLKRILKPSWLHDQLEALETLDDQVKKIYPKLLMLQLADDEDLHTNLQAFLLNAPFFWNRMLVEAHMRYKLKTSPSEVLMPRTILLSLQRALVGNVPPTLRGVTIDWEVQKITIRFIFTGEITEDDIDRTNAVITEVYADLPNEYLINDEIIRVDDPEPLGPHFLKLWAYRRFERNPEQINSV